MMTTAMAKRNFAPKTVPPMQDPFAISSIEAQFGAKNAKPFQRTLSGKQILTDIKSGLTRWKKDDLGLGSIEEKYGLTFSEMKIVNSHPKIKGIKTSIPTVLILDDFDGDDMVDLRTPPKTFGPLSSYNDPGLHVPNPLIGGKELHLQLINEEQVPSTPVVYETGAMVDEALDFLEEKIEAQRIIEEAEKEAKAKIEAIEKQKRAIEEAEKETLPSTQRVIPRKTTVKKLAVSDILDDIPF